MCPKAFVDSLVIKNGNVLHLKATITDLFHKWRPTYYSFQYVLINPTNLVLE